MRERQWWVSSNEEGRFGGSMRVVEAEETKTREGKVGDRKWSRCMGSRVNRKF